MKVEGLNRGFNHLQETQKEDSHSGDEEAKDKKNINEQTMGKNPKGERQRRWREIEQCYYSDNSAIRWVTRKKRGNRRKNQKRREESNNQIIVGISLSDSHIEQRNQTILREQNKEEVEKLMELGRRLGVQTQGNDIEIKEIEEAKEKMLVVDLKGEEMDLEQGDIQLRKEGVSELWDGLRKKESLWRQKSRALWIRSGDANTRFFHRFASCRRSRNAMHGLWKDDSWVKDPTQVKNIVSNHFKKQFSEVKWKRPLLEVVDFKRISKEDNLRLEAKFLIDEVRKAVVDCNSDKVLRPNGFNFKFINFAWHMLEEDIMQFVKDFHTNRGLVRGLNSSFIVLIPKTENPIDLKDFRPISLIGSLYKIMAKLLANRLKGVMDNIISENQSAFVGKRRIVDGILVLNEIVDEIKRRKSDSFILKVDFEKAYDCVNWNFLNYMMEKFGFGEKWRDGL
ncbi:hypothetical protein SLEP1_g57962 [Rubroshorea leprosula]|uniref:Reverse transcriptase domain-containing protein n=1 Tax=Rubroshorea leprosula TaxID=152421 RepID=A0AAV5MQM0_9ROSI|nr:hypothetical protein SLEP1_g57962 [Rubroshorea leprosula]